MCIDVDPERHLAMEELCVSLENSNTLRTAWARQMVGEWVRYRRIRQEVRRCRAPDRDDTGLKFEAPPPPPNQLQRSRASTQNEGPASQQLRIPYCPTDLSGAPRSALMVYGPDWTRGTVMFCRFAKSDRT